jgi:hypothetical protein
MDLYSQGRHKFNLPLPGEPTPCRGTFVLPAVASAFGHPTMLIGETICTHWTFEGVAWYALD